MKAYLLHLKQTDKAAQKQAGERMLQILFCDDSDGKRKEFGEKNNVPILYGAHGKPYLKGNPWYFNISHSGEYLLFVQGQFEIGADLQITRHCNIEGVTKKFCPEERTWILEASEAGERLRRFYIVWCRKESYGKYLGCGLTNEILSKNTLDLLDAITFLEYDILEDYHICICCKKEEEIEEAVHLFEGL